ncbi:MAG TPA: ABC-type transport auxiliary lipoprotein family protein [Castellaniella sp.]|nr:ABC-type transport auxiliary lipoprotein family protein [Castellaniella sp.]
MRRSIAGWACGAAALLAGCASAPSHYYSLAAPLAPAAAGTSSAGTAPYGLRLQVLGIPADAERPQLLVRDPAREPSVEVLNQSLWAAPLADQIQAVLAGGAAALLRVPDLQRLPAAGDLPVRSVDLRVTRFDLVWGRGADLAAVWTDRSPGAKAARVCQARLRAPASEGVAELVEAQRRALQGLARLIAHPSADASGGLPAATELLEFGCT